MDRMEAILRAIQERQNAVSVLKKRQSDLERQIESLMGEIRGLEFAQSLMTGAVPEASPSPEVSATDVKPDRTRQDGSSKRSLSPAWRMIIKHVASQPGHVASLDDMEEHANAENLPINRAMLRTQMSNYVRNGYMESAGRGQYRVTEAGIAAVGGVGDEADDTAEPSNAVSMNEDQRSNTEQAENNGGFRF